MSSGLIERLASFFALPSQSPYDPPYGDPEYPNEPEREQAAGVMALRAERSEFAGVTIIRAEPADMEEATAVADEIKHRLPVVLNLQAVPEHEATRIRDFLGGVTYGLNGYMRRIAEWVYICSPFDMPVEKLVLGGTNVGSRERETILGTPEDF